MVLCKTLIWKKGSSIIYGTRRQFTIPLYLRPLKWIDSKIAECAKVVCITCSKVCSQSRSFLLNGKLHINTVVDKRITIFWQKRNRSTTQQKNGRPCATKYLFASIKIKVQNWLSAMYLQSVHKIMHTFYKKPSKAFSKRCLDRQLLLL